MRYKLIILVVVLFSTTTLFACKSTENSTTYTIETPTLTLDTIKISAMGDIQLGTAYPNKTTLPAFSPVKLFENVQPFFEGSDIVFGNLEGVLTDNLSQVKSCSNPSLCYFFGMPTKYAADLKSAGFNLMSIANNHVNDFGQIGKMQTQKALKDNEIHFAGQLDCPADTFTVNGVKYGFCAFSANKNVQDVRDLERAKQIVKQLAQECDIVIVSFHAGGEGVKYQHVTRATEQCFGENRGNVYQFAHAMIDAGADILLGHGPHVTRAVEVYKNRFIAYSMGNFCTFSNVNILGVSGLSPLYNIFVQKDGSFIKAQVVSTCQERKQPVIIDSKKEVFQVIKSLTFSDFPEIKNKLEFSADGWITTKE